MQTKMPGLGSAPITVMSLRRQASTPTIEFKVIEGDVLVGRTNLAPLPNKWIDTEVEIKVGNGSAGHVGWIVRSGGATVLNVRKSGVDT
ncbi:hypothetical protein LWC34_27115 [Kibdelosporangium philippinense]|uniref:Uncharacterized protein n=1 Tax=Kibdelosporangium philippinense TaxID=211113 RepID=A0ABS8ZF78_9PSEU|nr:hypothetical protein [Kibdelosporangium philippinense]MCE7006471.1 hypothetical protein [Kibdelosporangium philippinense]